jgi:predicted GIY-YIG superfamily endonuclease
MSLSAVWHLYLVECADGSLYTGITTDVARRYAAHANDCDHFVNKIIVVQY